MTPEEIATLAKGATVYIDAGGSWGCNALLNGREHRIEQRTVVKVNAKTVAVQGTSYRHDQLISAADAQVAFDAFSERKRKIEAERARITAAIDRVKGIPGFNIQTYSGLTVSASGVDDIERLAATLVTAHRGRELAEEIGRALPVEDCPVVTLHMSVDQAQRVLAALRGPA